MISLLPRCLYPESQSSTYQGSSIWPGSMFISSSVLRMLVVISSSSGVFQLLAFQVLRDYWQMVSQCSIFQSISRIYLLASSFYLLISSRIYYNYFLIIRSLWSICSFSLGYAIINVITTPDQSATIDMQNQGPNTTVSAQVIPSMYEWKQMDPGSIRKQMYIYMQAKNKQVFGWQLAEFLTPVSSPSLSRAIYNSAICRKMPSLQPPWVSRYFCTMEKQTMMAPVMILPLLLKNLSTNSTTRYPQQNILTFSFQSRKYQMTPIVTKGAIRNSSNIQLGIFDLLCTQLSSTIQAKSTKYNEIHAAQPMPTILGMYPCPKSPRVQQK